MGRRGERGKVAAKGELSVQGRVVFYLVDRGACDLGRLGIEESD